MTEESTRYAKELADLQYDQLYQILKSRLNPDDLVLDVGCGDGSVGALLAESGATVHGIEPNSERAALAAGRLRFVDVVPAGGDLSAPEMARPYDVITLLDVIEHLPDPVH